MKQRHYIYAILLTFPLFFISGCDDAMQTKSNSNNVQLDESGVKNAVMEALQQDDLFARSNISVMSSNG